MYNIYRGKNMKILIWNIDFWRKQNNENWKKFSHYLIENEDFDFLLLQEINPYFIYDIKNNYEDGPMYFLKIGNKNIYYHELKYVLKEEYYKPNVDVFWGASIIANEKYTMELKHTGENYWGFETLMCYDFKRKEDGKKITIMNFYKKGMAYYAKLGNYEKAYVFDEKFFLIYLKLTIL
jgi:hypothetical protein